MIFQDTNELVTSLRPFSSLRLVSLLGLRQPWDPEIILSREIEAAMILYTSRIMKQIPTIEAFFLRQDGVVEGWIHDDGHIYSTVGRFSDPLALFKSKHLQTSYVKELQFTHKSPQAHRIRFGFYTSVEVLYQKYKDLLYVLIIFSILTLV